MRSLKPFLLLAPVLALASLVSAATPAPAARWSTTYENLNAPANFTALMVVVDFPPGSVYPLHSHGGPVIALVTEGEITLSQNGTSKVYKAGQGFNEPFGQIHEASNQGKVPAVVVVTYLLAKGAQPDILVK
ncbi:MAG TPA: cupin domain-containing protein [Deinococcales bacterium]|nr:cupin domain-containing protein [Deinococcales bacterium]